MPRRNRNADAVPINYDQLADEAAQLARELHRNALTGGCPRSGKSNTFAYFLIMALRSGQVTYLTDEIQAIHQTTSGRR